MTTPSGGCETPEDAIRQIRRIAERVAMAFTSPWGYKNPAFDPERDEGPDNPYHEIKTMDQRVHEAVAVVFRDGDGHNSLRFPSCWEIAATVIVEVEAILRERIDQNQSQADRQESS